MNDDYNSIMDAIIKGDLESLVLYSELVEDFPNGEDHFINRQWITNAIDCGNLKIVEWMIKMGVSLVFNDAEGYSVLHSAIEREKDDKYAIMQILLENGADINAKGINGWTPAHMAAVRNDLEALILLKKLGADFSVRTEIDDYATPYEEALSCGAKTEIIEWLKKST